MKVSVIGHIELVEADLQIIAAELLPFLKDPDVEEFLFAAREGASVLALAMAYDLAPECRKKFTLVFPDRIITKSPWGAAGLMPAQAVEMAARVVELQAPLHSRNGFRSLHKLGEYLVNQVVDCGQLLAFWNGTRRSVTGHAVRYAQEKDVAWQQVSISGPVL